MALITSRTVVGSTYQDAMDDSNAWQYCNYDDGGVGFPRDCGRSSGVGGQWNSWAGRGGQGNVAWSIDDGPATQPRCRSTDCSPMTNGSVACYPAGTCR